MSRSAYSPAAAIVAIALLCATADVVAAGKPCHNEQFSITADFEGGNYYKCRFKRDGSVKMTIRKEDREVTIEQPWFSFRITATKPGDLRINLEFPEAYARYWPKLSNDGINWRRAAEDAVEVSKSTKTMFVDVEVDPTGLWVSAQELLTLPFYDEWLDELTAHDGVRTSVIGKSVEGRPIHLAKTANRPEAVLLLGRQHPAEVPGAIAMRDFVDVLMSDAKLARDFRQRYTLLVVPLMNPDGVVNGHWRHNSGRTDLNRDWGPFTQPETQSIAKLLAGLEKTGMRPRLMLDFHATKYTDSLLFYTQTAEDETDPRGFATRWLTSVAERIPDYEFIHDPRPTSAQPNTKGYFYTRYGIPSFTYEVGDEVDREAMRKVTPVFAQEMMRIMLAAP